MMKLCWLVLHLIAIVSKRISGFYIPGVKPKTYERGEDVKLLVNSMTSIRTQVPTDYYDLPFCLPPDGPEMVSENLGQFLTGNKIQNSPYRLNMFTETNCAKLCQVTLTSTGYELLKLHIEEGYHNNWIIDNLPSAGFGFTTSGEKIKRYGSGFPLGFITPDSKRAYIYNHVSITIDYHQHDPEVEGYRIVGFAVEPMSIHHEFEGGYDWDGENAEGWSKQLSTCSNNEHMDAETIRANQIVKKGEKILFTYDVNWKFSDTMWASRWDVYLSEDHLASTQLHWSSIINSLLLVSSDFILINSILKQNRDGYNAIATRCDEKTEEYIIAETSWEVLHADVFRPPGKFPMLYAVFVGTGAQLFFTTLIVICFCMIGLLSPARRGSLITTTLVLYTIFGSIAGYVSSRIYKSFGGCKCRLCTLLTAILFPGVAFFTFSSLNILLYFHSSVSAPFMDVMLVAIVWGIISIPLVFFGAYFGYRRECFEYPTVTNDIARAIPPCLTLRKPVIGMAFAFKCISVRHNSKILHFPTIFI